MYCDGDDGESGSCGIGVGDGVERWRIQKHSAMRVNDRSEAAAAAPSLPKLHVRSAGKAETSLWLRKALAALNRSVSLRAPGVPPIGVPPKDRGHQQN